MLFRKFLIWIRDKQRADAKNLYFYCVAGFLAFGIISLLVDSFVPWDGWWTLIRSALLVPIAGFGFVGLYALSLDLSERKHKEANQNEEEWVPFRLRYSPKWRRNVSLIIGAVVVVIAYASENFVGYTIASSLIAILALALIAFCRLTRSENKRAELNIFDPRDSMFEERMKQYEREKKRLEAEANKSDEEDVIYKDDDDRVIQSTEAKRPKKKDTGL